MIRNFGKRVQKDDPQVCLLSEKDGKKIQVERKVHAVYVTV